MALWGKRRPLPQTEPAQDPTRFTRALRRAAPVTSDEEAADPGGFQLASTQLEAVIRQIKNLKTKVSELGEIAASALAVTDIGNRALLAERFEDVRNELAENGSQGPAHLLRPDSEDTHVFLPGNAVYVIRPVPFDLDNETFHLPMPKEAFSQSAEINNMLAAVDKLMTNLDRAEQTFQGDLRFVTRRAAKYAE